MRWCSIVPLIGGITLGSQQAFGTDPSILYSYPSFRQNEKYLKGYLNDVPWKELDESKENRIDEEADVVSTICPCAGLSMLNPKKGDERGRGSGAIQNRWLFHTAELVLSQMKPPVFWGENSYNLFTEYGESIRSGFWELAQQYGYSLTVLSTASYLHGIPQKRKRCFYFFWKGSEAPQLSFYNRSCGNIKDFLKGSQKDQMSQRYFHRYDYPLNDPHIYFIMNRWRLDDYQKYTQLTAGQNALSFIYKNGVGEQFLQFLDLFDLGSLKKRALECFDKKNSGKNFWDSSPYTPGDRINAVNTRTMRSAIHPADNRFINMREYADLMGMPQDFIMLPDSDSDYQLLTQNVPVPVARDWAGEIHAYLSGERSGSGYRYQKVDNIKGKSWGWYPTNALF